MKKIFALLIVFFLAGTSVFSATLPRWNKRPIKVYIPSDNAYKYSLMKAAFQEWQDKTYSAVWFTFIGDNRKNEADITVNFVDIVTTCNNPAAIGCTRYYVHPQTKFYTKSVIDIGSRSLHELQGDDGTIARKTVPIPSDQMYGVMLHEIGHAIGLEHSNNVNSLMYKYSLYDLKIPQHLTDDDLRLLYKTYR